MYVNHIKRSCIFFFKAILLEESVISSQNPFFIKNFTRPDAQNSLIESEWKNIIIFPDYVLIIVIKILPMFATSNLAPK